MSAWARLRQWWTGDRTPEDRTAPHREAVDQGVTLRAVQATFQQRLGEALLHQRADAPPRNPMRNAADFEAARQESLRWAAVLRQERAVGTMERAPARTPEPEQGWER